MKYNGFYYWMFESSMKKVLVEKYGKQYANEIMRKSKKTYRELVEKADDIGDGNPMAYNELFALAVCGKREEDTAGNDSGDDAPGAVSREVVFQHDRPEHAALKGREQEEHHKVRQVVHAGKGEAVPDLVQGGLRRSAARGRVLLPHHPLPDMHIHGEAGRE